MGEGRRRPRWIWILPVALVVVVAAGALVLRAVFTPERLRAEIARAGETALGVPVELRAASLSLFPPAVALDGVRVAGAAPDDPPLLLLESGRARLALAPLLRGRLVVRELRFDRPEIALRRDGAGVVLPGTLGAAAGAPPGPPGKPALAPASTVVERLTIQGGTLRLSGPEPPGDLTLEGIDLAARVEVSEGGDRVRSAGELHLAGLSLAALEPYRRTLDALAPSVRFDLDYRAAAGELTMSSVGLVAGPLDLGGAGRIDGLPAAPRVTFDVQPSTVALEQLLPLVPSALLPEGRTPRARGPVRVAAHVEGPLGDPANPPAFRLELGFDGAELGMDGFPVGLRELRGDVAVADTEILFRALTAALGDGSLRLDGRVAGPRAPDPERVDLGVRAALDLGLVQQGGFLPEGTELAGRVDADVKIAGRATAPEQADLAGEAKLSGGRIVLPDLPVPVKDLAGRAELRGGSAVLRDISGSLGSSTFRGEGRVDRVLGDPFITLWGTCPRLDLVELAPPPAAAKPGAGGGPGGAPPPPVLVPELAPIRAHLELAVDTLIAPNTAIAKATLTADLADGKAKLKTTMGRATFGEGVTLHDVTGEGAIADGRLTATFRAPRGDAHRLPLGAIDGKVDVAGHTVEVRDVKAGLFTGRIEGGAVVDMANPLEPAFAIESKAVGLQANDFVSALTPARDVIHGTLNLTSQFSGKGVEPKAIAQSLVAEGTFDAREGRLSRASTTQAIWKALRLGEKEAIQFRELAAPFSIRGGKLITDRLEIGSPEATWRASGALGFDGKLDYRVEVELGDALASEFRRRAGGDLAKMLSGSSGKITLDLRVTGPANSPDVALDTSRLADRVRQGVTDEARRGLDSAKDRLLDRLGVGATPPDTAKGDTAAADTAAVPAKPKLEDALRGLLKKGK